MTPTAVQGFDQFASARLPSRDPRAVRQRLILLERVLEGMIRLPFGRQLGRVLCQRVGLDGFIGLVPVAGDILSAVIGTYLVWEARNLGLSRWACARMMGRVGVDAAVGAIPVVGDVLDFVYRSNTRNVKALLAHIERGHPGAGVRL